MSVESECLGPNPYDQAMRYLGIGAILGPVLPAAPVELGNSVIRPATAPEIHKVVGLRVRPVATPSPLGVGVRASELDLQTNHLIEVSFLSASTDEAAKVGVEELQKVLAVLHTATTLGPYHAVLGQLKNLDTGESVGPWGPMTMGRLVAVAEPPDGDFARLNARLAKLNGNATAKKAARYLQDGVGLLYVLDGQTPDHTGVAHAAGLLNLFKCIETLANHLCARMPPDQAVVRPQQESIVAELAEELGKSRSLQRQMRCIRETKARLDRLKLGYLGLCIDHAGSILDLEESAIDEAKAFNSFRNKHLSHPSTDSLPPHEMAAWQQGDRALNLAVAYFARFLDLSI